MRIRLLFALFLVVRIVKPYAKQCEAGQFLLNIDFSLDHGKHICKDCNAGDFCPGGPLVYQWCGDGSSNPPCVIGNYSCNSGSYCPPKSSSESNCGKGYYCTIPSKREICQKGYYCASPRETFPEECPEGYYCDSEGLTSPSGKCQAGYYCPKGSTNKTQVICPAGSYCKEGSSNHTKCTVGSYCPEGSIGDSDCGEGYYCETTEKRKKCELGYYCASPRENFHSECPPGSYCDSEGLTEPSGKCQAGYYCLKGSTNKTANMCPAGKYCVEGSSSPSDCSIGSYCEKGSVDDSNCGSGFYCTTPTSKIICPEGSFCDGDRAPGPTNCTAGYYCEGIGKTEVTGKCKQGYYCPEGSISSEEIICPSEYYCVEGSAEPTICSIGSYCPEGSFKDEDCGKGYYCNTKGNKTICPEGYYCPDSRETKATKCTSGYYCEGTGNIEVTGECSAGYYCPQESSSTTQFECPEGNYCPKGSTAPIACSYGTYCPRRSGEQQVCPPGYYCPTTESKIIASIGYYVPGNNSKAQTICPEKQYCATEGLFQPTGDCAAGYYCLEGSTSATQNICPAGSYCPVGTGDDLKNCQSGSYCPVGSGIEGNCEEGYYCSDPTTKTECEIGYYCPTNRTTNPKECEEGYYCASKGLSQPTGPCAKGYYCPDKSTKPTEIICPAGYFCTIATGDDPNLCKSGSYCGIGSFEELDCPAGSYCPSSSKIFGCDPGYYCPNNRSIVQDPCPAKSYCETANLTSPTGICPAGYYCTEGSIKPTKCADGKYCPIGSSFQSNCNCNGVGSCSHDTNNSICYCNDGYFGENCISKVQDVALVVSIVSGISFCVILLVVIGIFIFICVILNLGKKLEKFNMIEDVDIILEEQKINDSSHLLVGDTPQFTINQKLFEIKIDDIKILERIGKGGSSATIYLSIWNEQKVAYKCFEIHNDFYHGKNKFAEFEKEVGILASISFPYILKFYGATLNFKSNRLGFVMEYAENGDLHYFLKKKIKLAKELILKKEEGKEKGKEIKKQRINGENKMKIEDEIETKKEEVKEEGYPYAKKIRMIYQISAAMLFLHNKQIIHRDLKLQNVLVTKNEEIKLMDFGLSKILLFKGNIDEYTKTQTKRIGTSLFMAPEIIHGNYSFPCDVFSFSIMLYIIFTNIFNPYTNKSGGSSYGIETKVARDPHYRPDVNSLKEMNIDEDIIDLITKCWSHDPEKRMNFKQITTFFSKKKEHLKSSLSDLD